MKTIEALVLDLSGLGIHIWEQDGYLSYSAPKGTMTSAVRSELAERKAEILAFLRQANLASHALVPPIKPAPPHAAPADLLRAAAPVVSWTSWKIRVAPTMKFRQSCCAARWTSRR